MTELRWPTFSFLQRLFVFYLTIWLGTGALTVIAICLWFAPVETIGWSGNAILGIIIGIVARDPILRSSTKFWMRKKAKGVARWLKAKIKRPDIGSGIAGAAQARTL